MYMRIFYDESGDFSLKTIPGISIVASLTCTDKFYEDICYFMNCFEKKTELFTEIKGSDLGIQQRLKICNFINKNRSSISITITMVDSRITSVEHLHEYRINQSKTFQSNKDYYISIGGSSLLSEFDRLIKIAEYATRMSDEEFLQSILIVNNVRKTIQNLLIKFLDFKYAKFFKSFDFVFDRKLSSKLSAMEKYLSTYIMAFLQDNPMKQKPLIVVNTWKKGHPFVDNCMNEDENIVINNIFTKGLQFKDSREEPGLRLIDIVSNTIYQYLISPNNKELLECYKSLKEAILNEKGKYVTLVLLSPYSKVPLDYPVYGLE